MKKTGATLLVLAFSLQAAISGASEVTDRCDQPMDNVYPLLPDPAATAPDAIKGLVNLINNVASLEVRDVTVHFPAGSYDPGSMVRLGLPYGGIEFKSALPAPGRDCLVLSYDLKFDTNFDFVKGGKLPGLYGGTGNTGGRIPNGHDGFSTRYIWKENGAGAVYAYLPTSDTWGTALGLGTWTFNVGQWHRLEQRVQLNTPGQADGAISIWYDKQPVYSQAGLIFRDTPDLKIDGLLFSTFFGGNNASFATPVNTHIQFRNLVMSAERLPDTAGLAQVAR
ncbi:polysaccharide lyase [Pseudomonas sp. SDO528_S397]